MDQPTFMADLVRQETWLVSKDCSEGLCSVYCPQWCYVVFPPPPPWEISDDPTSPSGPAFSPLVIAIVGILAGAFLLVTYYTIISRYCSRLDLLRRRGGSTPSTAAAVAAPDPENPSVTWNDPAPPSAGLDEALISRISVYSYRSGEGVVDGTDCSVCLSEFRDEERLRLLPKCSHAFHVRCIDTWLKSHSNCPLCRAAILPPVPELLLPPPPQPPPLLPLPPVQELPAIETTASRSREVEGQDSDADRGKEPNDIVEIGELEMEACAFPHPHGHGAVRRSLSMGSTHCGRLSIADVLRLSMEDEYYEDRRSEGPSRRGKGSGSSRARALHSVMRPVPMKRSCSSSPRSCFKRNSLLPL